MASVTKRLWDAPDGSKKETWAVRYKDRGGAYRQRSFKRKKDADAYRSKVEQELLEGEHIAASQRKSVEFVADEYKRHIEAAAKRGAMRETTVAMYLQRIRTLVLPTLGGSAVNELEPRDIELWVAKLREEGYAPKTVTSCIGLLHSIMTLAIRYRYAKNNPVSSIAPDVRRATPQPIREFALDDIRLLLATAAKRYPKSKRRPTATLQCFVSMGAFLGMRWGEIAGLQMKNLDLDAGLIRVRTSLSRFGDLYEPKTKAGNRDIRLPTTMVTLLRAYIADFPPAGPDRLLFESTHGYPISYASWWTKSWSKLLERAGLAGGDQRLRFHALRHFAASWAIENGWPLPDVAYQLGHANVGVTLQVYAHTIEKRAQSLAAMDELADKLTITDVAPVEPSRHALPLRKAVTQPLLSQ